ncbi:MAG: hypothetical protein JKY32_15730 [Rhizobiales bacterium]|nr:hypothetical protein [Hyphomicrobiales bacterium]
MDIYHSFFSLNPGSPDTEFSDNLATYLDGLQDAEKIASWRLMRRKLGLGPRELGEFHLMIEIENLAQLDEAFTFVSTRDGDIEMRHHSVNSMIDKITFALYRDFPDPHRVRGAERF